MGAGGEPLDLRGWADSSITSADLGLQAALVLLVALVAPHLIHHRHAALRGAGVAALLLTPGILLLYSFSVPNWGVEGLPRSFSSPFAIRMIYWALLLAFAARVRAVLRKQRQSANGSRPV
jgi:hypothetical protein